MGPCLWSRIAWDVELNKKYAWVVKTSPMKEVWIVIQHVHQISESEMKLLTLPYLSSPYLTLPYILDLVI